jgi:AcrR family transcriptional regulator
MDQQASQPRLGDEYLGDSRHICALFDGPEAESRALFPFVVDGLQLGDRVVWLSEDREEIYDRLAAAFDVAAPVGSGQLDIRPWSESYLASGRFTASAMLRLIRDAISESAAAGYKQTRLVGEMEWAQDGVPGVEELITYEAGVDVIAGAPPNTVICSYDVRRHSASRIAAVLAAHDAAFVGGRLQGVGRLARGETPRDRIVSAASRMFAKAGVRATGVDALIEAAGVAKATFYRHFSSKDGLIVAWLQDPRTRWFEGVRGRAEALAQSPDDVVPQLFRSVADWLEAGDYRGCPYLNTAVELADQTHPASTVIRSYLREIEQSLAEIVASAGYRDSARLGTELQTLVAGSIMLGVSHRTGSFAVAAGDAATQLLADSQRA